MIVLPGIGAGFSGGGLESAIRGIFSGGVQGVWYDPSDINLSWRTNLLTYSQEFDNVAWIKGAPQTTTNTTATTAPDGTTTADLVKDNSSGGTGNLVVYQNITLVPNQTCTFSVYLKNASLTQYAALRTFGFDASANGYTYVDIANGTIVSTAPQHISSVQNVGNGWYRFQITVTLGADNAGSFAVYPSQDGTTVTVDLDGTSGLYIWGAQLENGTSATQYQWIATTEVAPSWYTTNVQPQPVLFQDSAGTTPVTAAEQPVGLMLDKSQGLVLGSELVDTANVAAAWTSYGTNTVTQDGDAVKITYVDNSNGAYVFFTQVGGLIINPTVGVYYKLTFQAKVSVGGSVTIGQALGGGATSTIATITSTDYTTITVYSSPTLAAGWFIRPESMGAGESIWIRNISVKEIPGNHASQSTSTSRPVLRARYNQLTYSEQFDNAAWTKGGLLAFGSGSTVNATTAPDGTTTADLITEDTSNGEHRVYQYLPSSANAIFSIYIKSAGKNFAYLRTLNSAVAVGINLTDGTTFTPTGGWFLPPSYSVESIGDGWYRCSIYRTDGGANQYYIVGTSNGTAISYTGDGTSGIYIWGADLRIGSSAGTYQRIAAATDYATAGFLPYLAFDGTDDGMATNSINFSATDKMSVCAGATKLLNARAALFDLSSAPITSAGSFGIEIPNDTAGVRGYFLYGSLLGQFYTAGTSAPLTEVLSVAYDIGASTYQTEIIPRSNGTALSPTSGAVAGTGNFGAYPLYIGRRGGSSLPFNGRIYSIIVCGKTLSSGQITQVEKYVGNKTGVTI